MEAVKPEKVIRLSKSCLSDAEKQAVMGVLDREYLGMGVEVQQFEEALTNYFDRQVVCVVNGTAALHLALQASGIGFGDEVLVQSLTYVASYQAISATGATPIACDIAPETLTLDWRDAERRITPRTKAVMPVHYAGGVGDLNGIYRFAEKYNLKVIEDAAHAFGSEYHGKRVGGFGEVACFSFDGIKNITSGEGGCIVTDDDDILRKVRDARLLGVVKDTDMRFAGKRSWDFDVVSQGWRYHMSNIMAAIGIEQLRRFSSFSTKRKTLARLYDELLVNELSIKLIRHNYNEIVPHIYVVQIDCSTGMQKIKESLESSGIMTGVHYIPNHYLNLYKTNCVSLEVVESIYPNLLTLPLHVDMDENDVLYICNKLVTSLKDSD